jgi:acyl carrier protein
MTPDDQANVPRAQLPPASPRPHPTTRSVPHKVRTAAEIQDWFTHTLAKITNSAPEDIDATVPFDSFGLDSVAAVGLTGELEDWLGCSVDPMAVYDYPTIELLSKHLAEESTRLGSST